MRRILIGMVLLAPIGCAPATPIVSDFNGDSVKIVQVNMLGEGARSDRTDAEADRICAKRGRAAEFASQRVLPNYQVEFLYLCL
ncbi:hypothetical protein [Cypionkella sp.]|uniref:hypothetical protein n=1 Tax=Cypionkella sp. TaxID=2811411 RepID=UPI002ABA8CCB|nr:hypothetical protein [Cypionkella sp.]MDZ4393530.1 hypothetical protein [Cypionkella sp.]